ncbi:MAG: hypothetical protein U9Q83_05465 [Bacteroidota bacterium]|nr:hypothetical protein [Bacteroidota bacterium]
MKKLAILLLFFIPFILISSCKDDEDKNNTQDSIIQVTDIDVQTFYLVPSPEDVFGFADDESLVFYPDYLNSVDNLSKYNTTKLQEFNFGVYAADLAYCAATSKNDESVKYLQVVRKISQKIGLVDVFNESLITRIEHVSPYKDSLISLSNDTYFDIIRYLERNDRPTTLAIMAAGGWIESIYLVVSQLEYSENSLSIDKITEQKLIVSNLKMFLKQYSDDDKNISSIYDEFESIFDLYDELSVETDDTNEADDNRDSKIIVVGGTNKIKITETQYNQLKKYIIDTRNKLTQNNVTL